MNAKIGELSLICPYEQVLHRVRKNTRSIIQSQSLRKKMQSLASGKENTNLLLDYSNNWISSFLMMQRYSQLFYQADSVICEIGIQQTFDLTLKTKLQQAVQVLRPFYLLQIELAKKNLNFLKVQNYYTLITQQINNLFSPLSQTLKQSLRQYLLPNFNKSLSQTLAFLSSPQVLYPSNENKLLIINTIQKIANKDELKRQSNAISYSADGHIQLKDCLDGSDTYSFGQLQQCIEAFHQFSRKDQILETAERRILSIPVTVSECQDSFQSLLPFLQNLGIDYDVDCLESVLFLSKQSAAQLQFYRNHHSNQILKTTD